MALIEIDEAAARRQLYEVVSATRQTMAAHAQRSADLAAQARAAFEREEAELRAALSRKAEAIAAAEQAREQANEQGTEKQEPQPATRPKQKGTLSLGGEEFQRERRPEPPKQAEQPERQPEPEQKPKDRPRRTLKLGVEDALESEYPDDPPPRRSPARGKPRPDGEDDLSRRTWLR